MSGSVIARKIRNGIRVYALVLVALGPAFLTHAAFAQADGGTTTITGHVKITRPSVIEFLATEGHIGLVDMIAFIKRDPDFETPPGGQQLTYIEGSISNGATYTLSLPIEPRGTSNDVSNGKGAKNGVQIYAVAFGSNFYGDAFAGPYERGGWPSSNASLRFDPGTGEVRGGMMVIWAPDDQQMFPEDFGPDDLLFTADDPVAPVSPGWTVISLDKRPFEQIRTRTAEIPIIEGDTGSVDLTKMSYTEAFDALVADLRVRYALTEFKGINYDLLIKEFRPLVENAERSRNTELFKATMFRFAAAFQDGHVSSTVPRSIIIQYVGGIGLILGETDDGVVIARNIGGSAAEAGIKPGAVILEWNGRPIQEAISVVDVLGNYSNPRIRRLGQLSLLPRMAAAGKATLTFQNPGETQSQTATLNAKTDIDGLVAALSFTNGTEKLKMPITAKVLPSGLGYIEVTTFSENPQLLVQTWEWALKSFAQLEVPGLIIDMRGNLGGFAGLPLYFAGSFYGEKFVLSTAYQADKEGKFVFQGQREVRPAPVRWTKPVAVIVGPYCASACELFAAAMARNPNHMIVGSYPTFGVAAGWYAPWLLPGGIEFNAPVVQPRTPDGKIFLENVGVEPNVKVPVTVESLLSDADQELPVAERALQDRIAAKR